MSARPKPVELLWLPLTAAALLAIYLPGLGNSLVYDDGYLADGELFRDYSSLELRARMLSYGSFVWLQELFGAGWWKQRLFNLTLHLATVVALWAFYREVLQRIEGPRDELTGEVTAVAYHESLALGVAIACFALNPVAVYAVAYLIQRSILMATLFTVLGLWLFARAAGRRRRSLYLGAVACYALAVLSKEHAVFAPLAALPLYIVVRRPSPRRLAAVALGGLALAAAAGLALRQAYGHILGQAFDEYSHVYLAQLSRLEPGAAERAFPLSIVNEAWLFFHYGLRWFVPAAGWMSINLRPPFPTSLAAFPQVLGVIGYLAVLAGGFFLLRHRDWRALLGLSLLLPALLFATEFTTVWVQDPFVLYRSYLWAIGVPGIVFVVLHGPGPRTLAIAGIVLASLLAWQAFDRVRSLSTPETAWTDAIRKLPNDARAVGRWFPYLNRGSYYVQQNQFQLAARDFEASAALGDLGMGALNLGAVLAAQGKHAEAMQAFDRAEAEGYRLYNLPFQKALSLMALGKPEDAYRQLGYARAQNPPSPTRELAWLHTARLAMQLGKPDEAIAALEQLRALDPPNREAPFLLAMAFLMKNDYQRARDIAEALVQRNPDGRAYYARALANFGLKRKAEALADIDAAIRLGPDNQNLRQWRARIQTLP